MDIPPTLRHPVFFCGLESMIVQKSTIRFDTCPIFLMVTIVCVVMAWEAVEPHGGVQTLRAEEPPELLVVHEPRLAWLRLVKQRGMHRLQISSSTRRRTDIFGDLVQFAATRLASDQVADHALNNKSFFAGGASVCEMTGSIGMLAAHSAHSLHSHSCKITKIN